MADRNPDANILQNEFKVKSDDGNETTARRKGANPKNSEEYLKAIYDLLKDSTKSSQSSAKRKQSDIDVDNIFRNKHAFKNSGKGVLDGFEDALKEQILGDNFKKEVSKSLSGFADSLGVSVKDLPNGIGQKLGKDLFTELGKSKAGAKVANTFTKAGSQAASAITGGLSTATKVIKGGGSVLSAGVKGLGTAAAAVGPELLAIGAAAAVVTVGLLAIDPALEGFVNYAKTALKTMNRDNDQRKKNTELMKKRLEADVNTLVEQPFAILKQSAQEVYDAWDKNVRLINATQGYNKSDLQNLMSNYASRLRSEGLDDVISGTSIIDNLASVLQSGLSGRVAEEFAYLATKLNAEIPTQDFFNYADTYASLAANAIKNGASQSEAISYANSQLEQFASDILYASRQLSGGFSTGLKNASTLFEQSTKIATAAKTGNASQIAGVLTSVSAIVGAIAPDLTDSITSAIYDTATGGNTSQIVALRSLAGINASNTEFLQQLARDPQGVFSTLFSNLANLQNMSNSNYMEVAEGLSDVFGISSEAFQRIDFNYLAKAISQMNLNNASLSENLEHLASGQTTTTTEQLKMQQINKYLIDEGLSYVLDNEATRAIQEHMWDEQLARQMTEAEYAVNLQGSALDYLESIVHTISNLLKLLNPYYAIANGVSNLAKTAIAANKQRDAVKTLLKASNVGSANARTFYNLSTPGIDAGLTSGLISMMYGLKVSSGTSSSLQRRVRSAYGWGTLSKSQAAAIQGHVASPYTFTDTSVASGTSLSSSAVSSARVEKMLATMESMASAQNKDKSYKYSYSDWAKTARRYGISNLDEALEAAGYSTSDVKYQYEQYQTLSAAKQQQERLDKEEETWDMLLTNVPDIDTLIKNSIVPKLESIGVDLNKFLTQWINYYVKHTAYLEATRYKSSDYDKIRKKEKKGSDSIVAKLANTLTSNLVDIKDPTVQTNVLLAEMLKVLTTIMQQNNNKTTSTELADSLKGLSLGLLK